MSTRHIEVHNELTHKKPERITPNYTGRRIGAGILLLAAGTSAVAIGNIANDAFTNDYDYSKSTHRVVADQGMGLEAIAKTVKTTGDAADLRDIESYLKETNPGLEDGLQVGEAVDTPDSARVS